MNGLRLAASVALLAGLALLAYGAIEGDVTVGLFLIVPFLYATGPAGALGIVLLVAAVVLWALSARWIPDASRTMAPGSPPADRQTKHGGVVLLGPIPIVWGSDRRILPWMVAAGVALLALALLVSWVLR